MKLSLLAWVVLVGFINCNSTQIKTIKLNNFNSQETHEKAFKSWIKDSLSIININLIKDKKEIAGFVTFEINLGADSLSLEVITKFELDINVNLVTKKDDVSNVLALLKEYYELPEGKFKLSFLTSNYYYPSSAKDLIYDNLFELKNLEVFEYATETTNFYSYIRGRINDKKVITKVGDKEVVKFYNFIWSGDSVIKEEISN